MLRISHKGNDEVARRTHRLGIKLRSVLLLLSKPQPVDFVLKKSAFPLEEALMVIDTLTRQGFIVVDDMSLPGPVAAEAPSALKGHALPPLFPIPPSDPSDLTDWRLGPEIILSEAKFLLIDFCVDSFSTLSEKLAENIRACQSVGELGDLLTGLTSLVNGRKPDRLAALRETVRKINETD